MLRGFGEEETDLEQHRACSNIPNLKISGKQLLARINIPQSYVPDIGSN